ncbi:unnamed protein product [Cuscuta europaea]|uniref:Uncharacterized protein n=1 Tax=Cuscuta europaea TaxID=41803 RepID=A0A9P0Z8T9_CUSEU|nr:unnamed protein product [Cuscuta europaea]
MIWKVCSSWIVFLIICSITISKNNAAVPRRGGRLYPPLLVGTVYCDDTCSQHFSRPDTHFISGASVAVECGAWSKGRQRRPSFRREVKTNDGGEFTVRLPFSVAKKIRGRCSVTLISSGDPNCAVASAATSPIYLINEERKKEGNYVVFSAGSFTFRPLKPPELCNQEQPNNGNSAKKVVEQVEPVIFPPFGVIPPNPLLPPPSLLPPNPLLPPPSIIPPIIPSPPAPIFPPLFPSPPPSIFPPLLPPPPSSPPSIFPPLFPAPPTPPASVFPPLFPPIPGFTPSPSPPPPPAPFFPFPFPPFPFEPSPGNPPPSTSSSAQSNSP